MANHPAGSAQTLPSEDSRPDGAPQVRSRPALQGVLWDMDGTIVDTEPYWIRAEKALVEAHGGTWTHEQATLLVGQALEYSAGQLQLAGVDLGIREIIDHLTERVTADVRAEVPWRPGARELLAALRADGVPCAMVTMSELSLASAVAGNLPEGTFAHLITGDRVSAGKPHPEAYQLGFDLLAADVPGLDKECVVAIEDSLPGVTSALAAGLVTLAVPHFVPLPADPRRTDWTTLEGRTPADLQGLLPEPRGAEMPGGDRLRDHAS
jgi:HAD superfamily hydrolase (TIGR01509 family)